MSRTAERQFHRKYNVLSKMVIPRERLSERYIISELEEIEREDNFRLKRFEELKQKKARAHDHKTPICPICRSPIDESNICICDESKKKQRFITCPMCNNDDNIDESEDRECICKDTEENKNNSEKNVSISDSIDEVNCTCDKAEGDGVMDLCPCGDKQSEVNAEFCVGTKNNNRTNNAVIESQKSCSCERIGEKKQNTTKITSDFKKQDEKSPGLLCSCEKIEEKKPNIPKSNSGSKTLANNLSEKFCSCEKIGDKKKNPVKVIKEVSDTPEQSCCCISSKNPDVDLENLCKNIVGEKINECKSTYVQKTGKEGDLTKVTFSNIDQKLECVPCRPEKAKSNMSSVIRNENLKPTSNYEENSNKLLKVCAKCNNEKSNAKDDSKNITIHIIVGSENQGNTKESTSSQNIKNKCSSKEVAPQDDKMNFDNSKDLGIFVTEFKEVVTIKRFQNEDGTIKEEKQIVTMKTEAKNPNLTDPIGDQNRQSCLSPAKVSLKQNSSACSAKSGKVKISLPPVDKKSSLVSNVSKDISVSSYTSCKTKSSNVSESTIESKVSIEEIECSSMGAQTGEPDKLSMNRCCLNNDKNKKSSATSSLSEKSSKSCMQHSPQKAKNDRSKSCCTIKIVSKPKDDKNQDKMVADQCFEIIKRLLIEANQSCQPKNKKRNSNTCTCKSKKGSKQLTSKTSQTSNSSCSSSVSTKSTNEKKCKCVEEKSKKEKECKKPTEKQKSCESDTCQHKTTTSTSNCKCNSKQLTSKTSQTSNSSCSSSVSTKSTNEKKCKCVEEKSKKEEECKKPTEKQKSCESDSCQHKITTSTSNCKCNSKQLTSKTSQTSNGSCSSSVSTKSNTNEKKCKCGEESSKKYEQCMKNTTEKPKSCESDTCQHKTTTSTSNCKCNSKQLTSKTSQTSNGSCSSSVSTKSNTYEKKCKCGEEKSKKHEQCMKKTTERPKSCESDTCQHKITASTSNCKCKSGASVSVNQSDKISQCSSCVSTVASKESICVHKKKESESQNICSCQGKDSNKSVQSNSKENVSCPSCNSKKASKEPCKCQSENKKNICSACGSLIAPISTSSSFVKCGQHPDSSIKSCCKDTSKDLSCNCKTKTEEKKCDCKKGSKKNISFNSPAPPHCKESISAESITSSNSFEKNQGVQTDCPKCIKSVAKANESSCSCKKQQPNLQSNPDPKKQCSCNNNASTKPAQKKVEAPKQTCSCSKESKPEPKCPVCAKEIGRNSAGSCQSNSESNIQQKKSCCSQTKRTEKSESKCSICAKKDESKCSCKSPDAKSTSSNISRSHSPTEKACPKCSQQDEIKTIKAPSQKSSCSCQTPKDNECCKKRSKSSVQFVESEIMCPACEPKSKEIGTSTRRSDRYDVRSIEMLKSAEARKPLACTCSSDTYVGLEKWYDNVQKAKSYHGQCFH